MGNPPNEFFQSFDSAISRVPTDLFYVAFHALGKTPGAEEVLK
jgi:hypothetical protein